MKVDWKTIQAAIYQIIEEYKFDAQQILEIVKLWIKSAYRKDYLPWEKKVTLQVSIDKEWKIRIFREYFVNDNIEDENKDITLIEAKKLKSDAKPWETIYLDITPENLEFSRIAVQAAAQTIKQNLKKIEKERFFEKFQDKQWNLLKWKIIRSINDNLILDIQWTSVILPPEWQIPNKIYNTWEEIVVLLKQISKWSWWIQLDITQSSNEFVEAILYSQIPELHEWTVKILKIVRFPWKRTKILIESNDDRIDPIWIFVWQYWDRITNILNILDWERIDFIENHEDLRQVIAQSLKPAKINSIQVVWNKAIVHIPSDQKAIAIWKWAVNIRLASQICWLNIEIVDEE